VSERSPLRLGFLASGGGTNMQAILDACADGRLHGEARVVIGNNSRSGALGRAREQGVPCRHLSGRTHSDPVVLDQAICGTLQEHRVEVVCLAGYMKLIGPQSLAAFRGRILNIHPGLLPRHGGQGFFGLRVHEAVLAAGDTESGATVHVVDEVYDNGPVLAQATVPVESSTGCFRRPCRESLRARSTSAPMALRRSTTRSWRRAVRP
jgi:phosphoribosylglycinamide formyltransferase-1